MQKLMFLLVMPLMGILYSADNQLTSAERKEGWILLFNGQSMEGWRTYKNLPENSWEVVNGQLHSKTKANGATEHADLVTKRSFKSFELQFDWKVEKGANSGLLYHVLETRDASYETGPEYQLIDDLGYDGKLEDWQKAGADYAMHPPFVAASKPAGDYNHTVMKVDGAHVQHWLNGIKVADFIAWTPEWENLKKTGKWKDFPDYGNAKSGLIAIQDHGGGIWFKNIKIREI
jgi:Domain of Unknown Function (DUF1080)